MIFNLLNRESFHVVKFVAIGTSLLLFSSRVQAAWETIIDKAHPDYEILSQDRTYFTISRIYSVVLSFLIVLLIANLFSRWKCV
jgi:hypothetical protein